MLSYKSQKVFKILIFAVFMKLHQISSFTVKISSFCDFAFKRTFTFKIRMESPKDQNVDIFFIVRILARFEENVKYYA